MLCKTIAYSITSSIARLTTLSLFNKLANQITKGLGRSVLLYKVSAVLVMREDISYSYEYNMANRKIVLTRISST